MTAGRRRRGRKMTRRGRKGVKKGGGYGFGGALDNGTNGPVWNRVSDNVNLDSATGAARPEPTPMVGARRRKSRKGSKKTRKGRKMRGGASQVSMGTTYASFTGSGERGIASYDRGVVQGNAF